MSDLVERLRSEGADAMRKQYSLGMWQLCSQAANEIDRLRRDCAELYQVIGTMSDHCPDSPAIVKALDNASAAAAGEARPHDDLLPFILPDRNSDDRVPDGDKGIGA